MSVLDVTGRRVALVVDEVMDAGRHELRWDGKAAPGTRVGAGMYFLQATAGGRRITQRFVLLE